MRICEVAVREGYYNELIITVQDLLIMAASRGVRQLSMEKFKSLLAKQGYVSTVEEIIQAVDQSGYASSVDRDKIVPLSELPDTTDTDAEPSVDVANLAGNQALKDIKQDL
jgi:hypothetical protein